MPFTIYHFGPAIFVFSLFPFLDPIALLIGSIIPDIEGFFALYILPQSGLPLHGPFHSFIGAIILGSLTGFSSFLLWTFISKVKWITISPSSISFPKSLMTALIGTFSHILLDSFLYLEMNPFFPVEGNPFLDMIPENTIILLCIFSFLLGILILLIRFSIQKEVFNDFQNSSRKSNVLMLILILILAMISFFTPIGMLVFLLLILLSFILFIIKRGFKKQEYIDNEPIVPKK